MNPLDYNGNSSLHLALQDQEEELVELLLQRGADPNQPSKDVSSPLHMVSQRGPFTLMELLLQFKADPTKSSEDGWTPLHLAARAGAGPKVAALLAAGAQHGGLNGQGNTPLHLVRGRESGGGVQKGAEALSSASGLRCWSCGFAPQCSLLISRHLSMYYCISGKGIWYFSIIATCSHSGELEKFLQWCGHT